MMKIRCSPCSHRSRARGVLAFLLLLFCCLPGLRAAGFRIRLGILHGHLRECWFGCETGASDKYDRHLDEMAPPPGIQTGYTAFISPDNRFYLYKDIRGFGKIVTWRFQARVYDHKTIVLRWNPKQFPVDYAFYLESGGSKKKVDMRRERELRIPVSAIIIIRAEKRGKSPPPQPRGAE